MSKLTLRYQYDASFFDPNQPTDDFGWLGITVETDRYSGQGGFWVQWQDVKEFGEALATLWIKADRPIKAQWGFGMQEGDDLILSIEFYPENKRGDIAVRFTLADHIGPSNRASGSFRTNHPELDAFRAGIALVMNREAEEATLIGS